MITKKAEILEAADAAMITKKAEMLELKAALVGTEGDLAQAAIAAQREVLMALEADLSALRTAL